jgi:ABC-2 type transport system ATP-binding protein
MARICFDHLTKRYGLVTAVHDLTVSLEPGKITGFLGPNGAGKSTTLRMLVGLTTPSAGTATIDGRPYAELDHPTRLIGAMTDSAVFHPRRSGRDALRVLCLLGGIPLRRADELIDVVGLTGAAARKVGGYSMGMRQRLGLARHSSVTRTRSCWTSPPPASTPPECCGCGHCCAAWPTRDAPF